jgi:hypothetical protein
MNLEIHKRDDLKRGGRLVLLYSEGGVGKTTSFLLTAPEPQLGILCEERSITPVVEEAERVKGRKIHFDSVNVNTMDNLIEFVATGQKEMAPYRSILLDGASSLMNLKLFGEILDEAFGALPDAKKSDKPIAMRSKMSPEGYGALGREMLRIIPLLGAISKSGRLVVITSLLQENPKWGKGLVRAAPAFAGKFFSDNYQGEVDLIGLVEKRYVKPDPTESNSDPDAVITYPPWVSFESPADDFICKWSGISPREGLKKWPLNLAKIVMSPEPQKGGTAS